jgi:hypothetical protein
MFTIVSPLFHHCFTILSPFSNVDRPQAGLPATYQPEFGLGRRTSRDVAGS